MILLNTRRKLIKTSENQRLNQQLKETKFDLNLFQENAEKTDEQMISKLLDQFFNDGRYDFNEILMERYKGYLEKVTYTKSPIIDYSLLRKFCSFEEILVEAEVFCQFTKELQKINNNFIQDEVLHAYKRSKIDSINDLNEIKTILPSSNSCWKEANERMKKCVDICCNFEHKKQGLKLAKHIEARIGKVPALKQGLLQQEGNKCLYLAYNLCHYYQITLASLPVTHIIKNTRGLDIDVTITVSPQNNVVSLSFKADANGRYSSVNPVLMDAAGEQELRLECVAQFQEYICEQSINELKDMGYIINDGFVFRIQLYNCEEILIR